MNNVRLIIGFVLLIFPWKIRRVLLNRLFDYKIHPNARIGFSLIIPDRLEMDDGATIGHLNMGKGIHLIKLGKNSIIGRLNWITGLPIGNSKFFQHKNDRFPALILGDHSAITNRHIIDCTDIITIGSFSTIAGFYSQFLTHQIDLQESRQDCTPIKIGEYCLIGTNCVFLPGSSVGNFCVISASSLVNKSYDDEYTLYGGVPAIPLKKLSDQMEYFQRFTGFVY